MQEHVNFNYSSNLIQLRPLNKKTNKYNGFIIWDSFNNPIFPISFPKYDENDFFYSEYIKRFYKSYSKKQVDILPWHFFIEFVNDSYLIYNTRPYNYMFPVSSMECKNIMAANNIENNDGIFNKIDVEDYLHILILGDSNADIYTNDIYFKIGRFIISAYKQFLYNPNIIINNDIHTIFMGSNFNINYLRKHIM